MRRLPVLLLASLSPLISAACRGTTIDETPPPPATVRVPTGAPGAKGADFPQPPPIDEHPRPLHGMPKTLPEPVAPDPFGDPEFEAPEPRDGGAPSAPRHPSTKGTPL